MPQSLTIVLASSERLLSVFRCVPAGQSRSSLILVSKETREQLTRSSAVVFPPAFLSLDSRVLPSRPRDIARPVTAVTRLTMRSNSFRAPPIHCRGPSDRTSLRERRKTGLVMIFMVGEDGSDNTTDQIYKYLLSPPFALLSVYWDGGLVYFEPLLTKRSISDQTNHTIHQLEIQSARILVYDKMQSYQRRRIDDDLKHQSWEDHST